MFNAGVNKPQWPGNTEAFLHTALNYVYNAEFHI